MHWHGSRAASHAMRSQETPVRAPGSAKHATARPSRTPSSGGRRRKFLAFSHHFSCGDTVRRGKIGVFTVKTFSDPKKKFRGFGSLVLCQLVPLGTHHSRTGGYTRTSSTRFAPATHGRHAQLRSAHIEGNGDGARAAAAAAAEATRTSAEHVRLHSSVESGVNRDPSC
jgi:hypothetical protein